jgi:putative transposase
MARVPRLALPDGLFHVTVNAVAEALICSSAADYARFLRVLTPVVRRRGWRCYSLCVMGTHYHLVLEATARELAAGMETLNGRYAKLFNRDLGRRGHLFRARYSSKPIESVDYLFEAIRYVVLNPVRAGLCRRPEQWPWGTYRALLGIEAAPAFFDVDLVMRLFAPTRDDARRALREFVDAQAVFDRSA